MNRQHEIEHGAGRTGEQARENLLAAMPLSERRLELAGVSTAVLEGGDGPPIVLLHGLGEFAAVWTRVIPDLVRTHRVVVPDLPGHGASLVAGNPLGTDSVSAWLDALVDATCTAPAAMVGHLLGGAIAARYAVGHSDRLSHLVLVDTLGLAWYRPAPSFALPMMGFVLRPSRHSRDRVFNRCFLDIDRVGDEAGDQWEALLAYALDRARTPTVQAALRRLMPMAARPIPADDLARIAIPTTLIHGRHDLQVRLQTAESASARYGWQLHIIDDCRDDPAMEQPDAFLSALRVAIQPDDGEEERRT